MNVDLSKSDFELFQAFFWRAFAVKCLSLQDIDWSKVSLCEDVAASDRCFSFFAFLKVVLCIVCRSGIRDPVSGYRSKNLHSPLRWAEAVRSAVELVLARASEPPTVVA